MYIRICIRLVNRFQVVKLQNSVFPPPPPTNIEIGVIRGLFLPLTVEFLGEQGIDAGGLSVTDV